MGEERIGRSGFYPTEGGGAPSDVFEENKKHNVDPWWSKLGTGAFPLRLPSIRLLSRRPDARKIARTRRPSGASR